MEEIPNNHLGCLKPCQYWYKLPINWCRISSIDSIVWKLLLCNHVFGIYNYGGWCFSPWHDRVKKTWRIWRLLMRTMSFIKQTATSCCFPLIKMCMLCFSMVICVFSLVFAENALGLALFCSCSWVPWRKSKSLGQITWNPGFYRAADENTEALPPPKTHIAGRLFVPFGKSYFEGRTVSFGQIISWGGVSLDYAMLSFRIKTIIQEYYQA